MTRRIIQLGQIQIRFLLESSDTNGALAMFEFTVPAGAKVPLPHSHKQYDETIFGLAGSITFTIEGDSQVIAPGQSCFIPRGAVHGFSNISQIDAKALAIVTPALLGPSFFMEMADILNTPGPPDPQRLTAVMAKHGLVVALPSTPTQRQGQP